jgi:hypothetical protein
MSGGGVGARTDDDRSLRCDYEIGEIRRIGGTIAWRVTLFHPNVALRLCRWGAAKSKAKRVALHLRVSTSEQLTRNQRRELEGVAARHKWDIVGVYEDSGISGAKGRDQRPDLDVTMKMVARREVDMVAAWSVDPSAINLIGRTSSPPARSDASLRTVGCSD